LNLDYDKLLSNFAFNCRLRQYKAAEEAREALMSDPHVVDGFTAGPDPSPPAFSAQLEHLEVEKTWLSTSPPPFSAQREHLEWGIT
jgi:hypothetical protein